MNTTTATQEPTTIDHAECEWTGDDEHRCTVHQSYWGYPTPRCEAYLASLGRRGE